MKIGRQAQLQKRRPLLLLSLLGNITLVGVVGWWVASGGSAWGGSGAAAAGDQQLRGARATCQTPRLHRGLLEAWGCKVLSQACFDQERIVVHSGQKTPGHPLFTGAPLFHQEGTPAYILPGYSESSGQAHHEPPSLQLDIRGPTSLDPPDVWQPDFERCAAPIVFWVPFYSVFADTYLGAVAALDAMQAEAAFDRNVILTPVTLGMSPPAFYQQLMEPLSRHKVSSLSDLSSREHIHDGQPRCFQNAVLCNLVHLYWHSTNRTMDFLKPKATGRRLVEHYRQQHPDKFAAQAKRDAAEGGNTFRVAFMPRAKLRRILNLQDVLEECRKWVPPASSPFNSVDCVLLPDGTPANFVDLVARLQNVNALVNTHGSGNTYAYFLNNGSALVEILPWNMLTPCIPENYADWYFQQWMELDDSMQTGYVRLLADADHCAPGEFERAGIGGYIGQHRDQDVRLDFSTLGKALERIALGHVVKNPDNVMWMLREDKCTGTVDEEAHKAETLIQQTRKRVAAELSGSQERAL